MNYVIRVFSRNNESDKGNDGEENATRCRTNEKVGFFKDFWSDNEEIAIEIGLSLDDYWNLNPKQFNKYVKVYNKKQQEEIEKIDTLNYLLGKYICFAFNDVKHYPKKPFLANDKEIKVGNMNDSDMERMCKYNVRKLGGKINE